MKIIGIPYDKYIYEFMVVVFWMTNENGEIIYEFRKNFENGFEADKYAKEINGIVVHRIRIQGKQLLKHFN